MQTERLEVGVSGVMRSGRVGNVNPVVSERDRERYAAYQRARFQADIVSGCYRPDYTGLAGPIYVGYRPVLVGPKLEYDPDAIIDFSQFRTEYRPVVLERPGMDMPAGICRRVESPMGVGNVCSPTLARSVGQGEVSSGSPASDGKMPESQLSGGTCYAEALPVTEKQAAIEALGVWPTVQAVATYADGAKFGARLMAMRVEPVADGYYHVVPDGCLALSELGPTARVGGYPFVATVLGLAGDLHQFLRARVGYAPLVATAAVAGAMYTVPQALQAGLDTKMLRGIGVLPAWGLAPRMKEGEPPRESDVDALPLRLIGQQVIGEEVCVVGQAVDVSANQVGKFRVAGVIGGRVIMAVGTLIPEGGALEWRPGSGRDDYTCEFDMPGLAFTAVYLRVRGREALPRVPLRQLLVHQDFPVCVPMWAARGSEFPPGYVPRQSLQRLPKGEILVMDTGSRSEVVFTAALVRGAEVSLFVGESSVVVAVPDARGDCRLTWLPAHAVLEAELYGCLSVPLVVMTSEYGVGSPEFWEEDYRAWVEDIVESVMAHGLDDAGGILGCGDLLSDLGLHGRVGVL